MYQKFKNYNKLEDSNAIPSPGSSVKPVPSSPSSCSAQVSSSTLVKQANSIKPTNQKAPNCDTTEKLSDAKIITVSDKIINQPILPNFPYSPFSSPHVSPEHRLHPNSNAKNYNSTVSKPHSNIVLNQSLKELRSVSVTEGKEGLTQLNQYNIREQLGQGSYGLVQLAYNQEDYTFYAMKILSKKKLIKSSGLFNRLPPVRKSTSSVSSASGLRSPQHSPSDPLRKIYREIAIHKKLNHPNIVRLIEVLDDPSQEFLYMVFEYVKNGAVMTIGKDLPFSNMKANKYFRDALLGVEYLHYQKIIHRDIKPANLLLSSKDQIKIADFGVSNEFSGDDVLLTSTAGSPAFMAPESVKDGEVMFMGKALDIWALGITLYAFFFSMVPYEHFNRYLLYQMILNDAVVYPELPVISDDALDLLQKMLDKNPLTRIKIQDIKTHPWVTDNDRFQMPSEAQNCGFTQIEVTDEEVANSICQIPKLETVIKVKMLLKQKSFRNPLKSSGSVSKISASEDTCDSTMGISQLVKGADKLHTIGLPNNTALNDDYKQFGSSSLCPSQRSSISPINEVPDYHTINKDEDDV